MSVNMLQQMEPDNILVRLHGLEKILQEMQRTADELSKQIKVYRASIKDQVSDIAIAITKEYEIIVKKMMEICDEKIRIINEGAQLLRGIESKDSHNLRQ